ncbi:MAG: hypothetical protein APF76_08025 [Desulfitibacter sp. BRH_c19]|nr:MAG: hypothetical protein APF76_08025 [Desulfitibacter sp. BRH_c19]
MRKRALILLIFFAMTFLCVSTVDAAVTNQDKYDAGQRMVNLEIVTGFPDGSLGLEQSITRAQFAKIALTLKSFDETDAMKENFTNFKDVTKDQWYTGWVNLAYKHEIIIGDPSGYFRPNDTISYQEAVTILCRLLGYENLPYHWPDNYLEQGEEIGLIEGLFERPDFPAPRGDVFVMLSRALDKQVVSWNTREGEFLPNEDMDTLLNTMLEDNESITGRVTKNFRTENSYNRNEVWIEAEDENDSGLFSLRTNDNTDYLLGLNVKIKHDDGLIFSLNVITEPDEIKHSTVSQFREAVDRRPADTTFKGDKTKYRFSDDFICYVNFSEGSLKDKTDYFGKFVLEEGKIAFASIYEFLPELNGAVVKDASARSLTIWNDLGIEDTFEFRDYRNVYLVDTNLNDINLDVLRADKLVYGFKNRNNELHLIVDGINTGGELTNIATNSITVNGTEYVVNSNYATFSTDSDSSIQWYNFDANKLANLRTKEVQLLLDMNGEVRHIRNTVKEETDEYFGILIDAYGSDFINHRIFRVFTYKGSTTAYSVETDSEWRIFGSSSGFFKFDDKKKLYVPIRYELNDDGDIKEGSLRIILDPSEIYNYNEFNLSGRGAELLTEYPLYNLKNMEFGGNFNYIQEGSRKFFINSNTLIMKYEKDEDGSHHKETLLTWDSIRNKIPENSQAYVVGAPGGEAKFVVFHTDFEQVAGQPYYGIVTETPYAKGDQWVAKINVAEEGIKEYYVEKKTSLGRGNIVKFFAYSNGDIDIITRYGSSTKTDFRDVYKTVGEKEDDYIELEPTGEGGSTFWYEFTDDTLIFDYDKSRYTFSLGRSTIKKNDRVIVLDDDRVIKVILKVNHIH